MLIEHQEFAIATGPPLHEQRVILHGSLLDPPVAEGEVRQARRVYPELCNLSIGLSGLTVAQAYVVAPDGHVIGIPLVLAPTVSNFIAVVTVEVVRKSDESISALIVDAHGAQVAISAVPGGQTAAFNGFMEALVIEARIFRADVAVVALEPGPVFDGRKNTLVGNAGVRRADILVVTVLVN
jgi:hypothetical protein